MIQVSRCCNMTSHWRTDWLWRQVKKTVQLYAQHHQERKILHLYLSTLPVATKLYRCPRFLNTLCTAILKIKLNLGCIGNLTQIWFITCCLQIEHITMTDTLLFLTQHGLYGFTFSNVSYQGTCHTIDVNISPVQHFTHKFDKNYFINLHMWIILSFCSRKKKKLYSKFHNP